MASRLVERNEGDGCRGVPSGRDGEVCFANGENGLGILERDP